MSKKQLALGAIILASLLWATAGLSAKFLLLTASPFVIGFWRFFLATLCILPFYFRENHPKFTWKTLILPSLIAALNVPFYYSGIRLTSANSATLIFTAGPLITAILATIFIQEKSSFTKWVGIFLGLLGVTVIILLPLIETNTAMPGSLVGNILISMGMISWTIYTIVARKYRSTKRFSPITMTTVFFVASTCITFSMALLTKQSILPMGFFKFDFILMLLYTAIFVTLVTYFLYEWAIEHISATTASFKQYLETVFAIILNGIFLHEHMTVGFGIGSICIIIGLVIATANKFRKT